MRNGKSTEPLTLERLNDCYEWAEVFGEGSGGNTTQDIESLDGTDCATCLRKDVKAVLGWAEGENDGDEWIGVFLMNDGRFLSAVGWCDYTGWDCQAGNTLTVASTLEALLSSGLTQEQRERVGL